jgi:3-oxoacyl-(acyl-carrier-protein) synthase
MKCWTAAEREETVQDLAAAIARAAGPLLDHVVPPDARGLYLATGDAGIEVSVRFWQDALAETPRFASPADFPWALANAPASLLARELDIRGPSYTLVGGGDAMLAALEHARHDLTRGRIAEALIVACDLVGRTQAAALVGTAIPELPTNVPAQVSATDFLTEFLPPFESRGA